MTSSATMLAAVHLGTGRVEVQECDRPEPRPGEVLVKIERAAICGSDLHNIFDDVIYPGYHDGARSWAPGRPGHEGVGTVVRSRSESFTDGDRVIVLAIGCFAEYMTAPAGLCLPLPPGQPFDRMLMAQQLGVCIYGMSLFRPERDEVGGVATLIGAGSIGLHFLQLLKKRGFERVIVSDLSPERLRAAKSLGADVVVLAPRESVIEATMDVTSGVGADLVVEAAGFDATRAQCVGSVRTHGRIGLFGYPESAQSPFPFDQLFWKSPVSIEVVKGAQRVAGLPTFQEAIALIANNEIILDHHLGTVYPLSEFGDALHTAREQKAIKVQLAM